MIGGVSFSEAVIWAGVLDRSKPLLSLNSVSVSKDKGQIVEKSMVEVHLYGV